MSTIPQAQARRALLKLITGNEPKASLLELRFREPDSPMRRAFYPCRDHHTVSARAAVLGLAHDVYVGCAPRVRLFGGEDAIKRVWCLWADLDGPEAMARLEAFTPTPSIVVASGTPDCAHAWWPLNGAPLRPDHARVALRRLAHALGADMRSAEPARILRLPGFSHKRQPPAPVECVSLELDSYTASQVVGHLPDPPGTRPPAGPSSISAPPAGDATDPLLALPASEYLPILTGRQLGADGKMTCPWHSDGRERTPSLHAYSSAEQGFWCYGCQRGGSIIDLGALLYGIEPRGRGYHEVRRRLAADLLPHVRAAA